MPIFVIQKKQLKLMIMEKENKPIGKENYRITIILKDGIIVEKFYQMAVAKDTITKMKELFPNLFIGGALEEKSKGWNVIWVLGNNEQKTTNQKK
nr:MAG TPA_asm: hypothetical protein [Microviridae sp.]